VRIDYRWSTGDAANTRKYAAELVALAPDGILTNGAAAVAPLLQVTRTLPPTKWQCRDEASKSKGLNVTEFCGASLAPKTRGRIMLLTVS